MYFCNRTSLKKSYLWFLRSLVIWTAAAFSVPSEAGINCKPRIPQGKKFVGLFDKPLGVRIEAIDLSRRDLKFVANLNIDETSFGENREWVFYTIVKNSKGKILGFVSGKDIAVDCSSGF